MRIEVCINSLKNEAAFPTGIAVKKPSQAHEFALFYDTLPATPAIAAELGIDNKELIHRIEHVLRLKQGEQLVLFNRELHAYVSILQIHRKQIIVEIISFEKNKVYQPHITFLLPVLKRDALSSAVYYLVEAGINNIQLIQSMNQQRRWGGKKEQERLERVCIAAAEQSKNFAFPQINDPISYENAMSALPSTSHRFLAHPDGVPFAQLSGRAISSELILTCGPEADLSVEEHALLRSAAFQSVKLTPTVLRAETAAFCISSLFRTVFSDPD